MFDEKQRHIKEMKRFLYMALLWYKNVFCRLHITRGSKIKLLLRVICCPYRFGELVAAGRWFHTAADAGKGGFHLVNCFSGYQAGNCLQVSITAAGKLYIFYDIAVQFHFDPGRTCAVCFIYIAHIKILLLILMLQTAAFISAHFSTVWQALQLLQVTKCS